MSEQKSQNIILETHNLEKSFYLPQPFKVLDKISIDAKEGEFVSLVGKSGSGKSTLLYCLSTMDTDYTGDLYICGEKITGKSPNQLAALRNTHIGFVFQFHYLLPEFTCLNNVMIPALKLNKLPYQQIEEMAYQKLDMLGLRNQALKQASKLSGGQQQRVSIARALINEPQLLLCDEPTGNLDTTNTNMVFDIFKDLSENHNKTILAVTHDNDFANASDRTIELEDGRIIS
ncbi:MAG: ATP-binding protein [Flavobacteriaceae bacterium]|nr:MAG: ATP-binding protein [Flavobacteriaceae bacterium]